MNCTSNSLEIWLSNLAGWLLIGFLVAFSVCSPAGAEQNQEPKELVTQGNNFVHQRDYGPILTELIKARDLDPGNIGIRRRLVEVYLKMNALSSALEEQRAIMKHGVAQEEDYITLGWIYYRLEKREDMVDAFSKAANIFGSEQSWSLVAWACGNMGDYKGSIYALRKMLSINPNDRDARLLLVRSLWANEEYELAVKELLDLLKTRKDRYNWILKFSGPLVLPLSISFALFIFSKNRHLAKVFYNSPKHCQDICVTIRRIIFIFVIFFYLRHFLFNPFGSNYLRQVFLSLSFPRIIFNDKRYLCTSFISLVLLPAFYMGKAGISIRALFDVPQDRTEKRVSLVHFGLLLLVIALVPAAIGLMGGQGSILSMQYRLLPPFEKVFVCTALPFAEEFGFIALILLLLKKHLTAFWSIFFCALLFLSAHYLVGLGLHSITYFLSGTVSAFLLHKTRSLWPSLALHSSINFAFVFL